MPVISRSQPLRDGGSERDFVLPALSIESVHFVRSTPGLLLRRYTTIPDSASVPISAEPYPEPGSSMTSFWPTR